MHSLILWEVGPPARRGCKFLPEEKCYTARVGYWLTAIDTMFELTVPICNCRGTAPPVGVPAGITTLLLFMPTNCGEGPPNVACAATPPIITVGAVSVVGAWSHELVPSARGAFTGPSPVARIV